MHELSILCEVVCCIIIYSPNCPEPDVWPSRPEAEQIIQRYKNFPGFKKTKEMANQESFTLEQLAKAKKQLNTIEEENRLKQHNVIANKNMSNNRAWVESVDDDYLSYLNSFVLKQQLEDIERRIAMLNQEPSETPQ